MPAHPATVLLLKDETETNLEFVVNGDQARKQQVMDFFVKIADDVAPIVGGKPITVKLLNSGLQELNSMEVK